MKFFLSFLFILSCTSFLYCNSNKKQIVVIQQVVTDSLLQSADKNKDRIDEIFVYFEKELLEEAKNWPVDFQIDTTIQAWFNQNIYQSECKSSDGYIIRDQKNKINKISFRYYIFNTPEDAYTIIDNHCKAYHNASANGDVEEANFILEQPFAKMPYIAFADDNIIYELVSTNGIGHIFYKAMGKLMTKYHIDVNDIILCQRKYIDEKLAYKIKPVINDWLIFYGLNIKDFYFESREIFDLKMFNNSTRSIYYREFTKDDDVYIPQLHDYSPDKTKFIDFLSDVDLGDDGKYHYSGSDDSHQLGLYDRKKKTNTMFSFRGVSNFGDAVFWIDNNSFIVAGYNSIYMPGKYVLEIYNLKQNTKEIYILKQHYTSDKEYYYIMNMKKRGIIID